MPRRLYHRQLLFGSKSEEVEKCAQKNRTRSTIFGDFAYWGSGSKFVAIAPEMWITIIIKQLFGLVRIRYNDGGGYGAGGMGFVELKWNGFCCPLEFCWHTHFPPSFCPVLFISYLVAFNQSNAMYWTHSCHYRIEINLLRRYFAGANKPICTTPTTTSQTTHPIYPFTIFIP